MFVDRDEELAFLDSLLKQRRAGHGQLILLYGRRRVGKSALLLHWAAQSGMRSTYWVAEKEVASLQRRKLYARLLGVAFSQAPVFESWADVWEAVAAYLRNEPHILMLDELPYAAESDPAMLSALQHAWDHSFRDSNLSLVLCGSHVRTMETLLSRQSPLFGRMTGQWHLLPFSFASLKEFFPRWSAEERLTAYAIVGGIPAYLEWLNPEQSMADNIHNVILSGGSMFSAEPEFLLYDEVREPQSFLSILKALGAGYHTLDEISNACLIGKTHLSSYLSRLQELRLVERRLPATLKPAERARSRMGRYHLSDAYFRFYFRFIAPAREGMPLDAEAVGRRLETELIGFIGQTAFEELAREWVRKQGMANQLGFTPDSIGSHWSRRVQADVVAVNWQARHILIGECKWGMDDLNQQVVRDLIEVKTPKVLADLTDGGAGWTVHYAVFARAGFTVAARALLQQHQGRLVNLSMMDKDL